MRNPTHIRPSTKRRIALLLFVTMLIQVTLIFPSNISVSAEDTDAILDDGIYTIDNVYLKDHYGVYGRYYVCVENGSVVVSTNIYGDVSDNLCRYW